MLDPMPKLRKHQGPWGLGAFAAVCSKTNRAKGILRGSQRPR